MGSFGGRKEGSPLTPPKGYYESKLSGGSGDESSYIPEAKHQAWINSKKRVSPSNPYNDMEEIDSSKISDPEFDQFVLPLLRGK